MRPTSLLYARARVALRLILTAAVLASVTARVYAEIIIPANPTITAFIQTTGPNAGLNIGDYRTHVPPQGDGSPHDISINVACTPGQTYVFQLFDPAVDVAGNPPGLGLDGVTLRVLDEVRGGVDNTSFQLIAPNAAVLANNTYIPGTSDADWTLLATVTTTGTPGVDCGTYTLQTSTANDDDNAWRFRLRGGTAIGPETFDPALGPDGVPGTGDESWIGIIAASYQHEPAGCQTFYWYVPPAATNLYMLNFDLDVTINPLTTSITYTTPSNVVIAGTASDQTVWNDIPPQQVLRPTFADMALFDVASGDLIGDATAAPESGLWQGTICVPNQNQYSFEVPGYRVYLEQPLLPSVVINKDDGVTTVGSPSVTTYTLSITNATQAAAMPIPGPEIVDTLPAGMSFASCVINLPLVGTCAETPPGSGTLNIDLQPQTGIMAYLPATTAAPNNTGTITVIADVNSGLASGTLLTNTATVDWTDIYNNNYPPATATDVDTVLSADVSIVKTDNPDPVLRGSTLTYTLAISNAGPSDAQNVVVSDTLPAGLTFVAATPVQTGGPNPLTWNLGTLVVGAAQTITVAVTIDPTTIGPVTNVARVTSTTPDPNPTNNTSTITTTIIPLADLSIVKSDQPDPVSPGNTLTYTLAIANAGPSDAQNTIVNDTLPAGVTFVSATPIQSGGPNPLAWNLGTFAAGASRTITVVVTVNPATTGILTNTATVTTTTPDPNPVNNSDIEPTTVLPSTAVELLYFRVDHVSGRQVHLAWATAAEIDNFGFNVYRAPADDFNRAELIHFEPSSIRGSGGGAMYAYTDAVPADGKWWYWLADVDTHGVATIHALASTLAGPDALQYHVYLPSVSRVP